MASGWGFDWVSMTTFWAVFVVGLASLVASFRRGGDGGVRRLDERVATGDLTSEEHEQRRRALRRVL